MSELRDKDNQVELCFASVLSHKTNEEIIDDVSVHKCRELKGLW